MSDIKIHHVDNWVGLYIDGERVYQGHRLENEDLLEYLNVEFVSEFHDDDEVARWISDNDSMPDTIDDLEDINENYVIEDVL